MSLINQRMGRTAIVIAHRLYTVRKADTIVVLEDKTIRETGTHDELMRLDGLYKRLYTVQQQLEPVVSASGGLEGFSII